ncbi:MAG: hypothetical protein A2X77_05290 [Gammaproteobacteria bacterium GWE2_42_36]|nr:MAG: hypothetical protein A2X77_05290 [Gammaproteobacteria bacterium GWE2_42_36]HCU05546.1 DNA-binding transcriptional regulator Fis [Coxiellaceae bacterium]
MSHTKKIELVIHTTDDHVSPQPLRHSVQKALEHYFEKLGTASIKNLYETVLTEIEAPLLHAVLKHTRDNQSKSAIILGLSRGTFRKKLKQHGLIKSRKK